MSSFWDLLRQGGDLSGYEPHPRQRQFLASRESWRVAKGSMGMTRFTEAEARYVADCFVDTWEREVSRYELSPDEELAERFRQRLTALVREVAG